jgi:predicted nucleotidyltransferase
VLAAAAERLGLRLVVRFGSRAVGAVPPPTPESDLDIAVLAGERQLSATELFLELEGAFPGVELDLALLNDADPLFRYEVLRRSDLLFGDPDLYAEYQAYAYRDFVDSADLRALEDVLSRRKLRRLLDAAA